MSMQPSQKIINTSEQKCSNEDHNYI